MQVPQKLITQAEEKAAEFHALRMLAEAGSAPKSFNPAHPCEFGVFADMRGSYAVAPLFPHVIADMGRDGFRCAYRTA